LSHRLTPTEFISKAREIHVDKYDYEIVYVYATDKITIVCPKHGKFQQTPSKHLAGQGCRKCGIEKRAKSNRASKSDFVEKARIIHGDKYNYDKVVYKTTHTKVVITCSIHGDFELTPANHTHKSNPQGCYLCTGRKRWSRDKFLEEAAKTHNEKYDYSKVVFGGLNKKVKILCPVHDEFSQSPAHHIYRQQGCPDCAGIKKGTKEKFVEKARIIHGDKYNYDRVVYKTAHTKVFITCSIHGDFEQTPANHTRKSNPQGCYLCTGRKRWSRDKFLEEAAKTHKGEYDYTNIVWGGLKELVEIICPFHGPFKQLPVVHLNGSGCQRCLSSKGETRIRQILEEKKIVFEEQYRFQNCSNVNTLPFDFLIKVNEKKALIEYHGQHHYEPVGFGANDEIQMAAQFISVKERDRIKERWCRENSVPLLIIPFSKYNNIELLLKVFINKLTS
jgi:hypothetical protein